MVPGGESIGECLESIDATLPASLAALQGLEVCSPFSARYLMCSACPAMPFLGSVCAYTHPSASLPSSSSPLLHTTPTHTLPCQLSPPKSRPPLIRRASLPVQDQFKLIKKTYHKKILEVHPDKGGDPTIFRTVRVAFEVFRHILHLLHSGSTHPPPRPGILCAPSARSVLCHHDCWRYLAADAPRTAQILPSLLLSKPSEPTSRPPRKHLPESTDGGVPPRLPAPSSPPPSRQASFR